MTMAMTVEIWRIPPAAVATFLWVNSWPVVPALVVMLALRWPQALKLAVLFVVSGSLFVALVTLGFQAARGAFNSAPFTNVYFANDLLVRTAYASLALLLIISWRRIRAVFAVTLAATLLFGGALLVFRRAVIDMFQVTALKSALLTLAAATSSQVAYYALYMLLALPVGLLVWTVLRWLAGAFERKAFSDMQLVADCWFAIVTMEAIASHLVEPFGPAGVAIGVTAFAAYRACVEIVLRVWPPPARENRDGPASRLLLLRVFGHQSRTERLFDHIAQRWRFRGPVQLIAGGDLAMRTVDPGDVLAFVSGRLRNQYVASADEVPARIERLDMRRDRDGRFRVNELYCLHDTWQVTLRALLAVTDAVVMDLRGFSAESRGVLYELQQIVATIATDRIVFITEQGIDAPLLEGTVARAWEAASDRRPPVAAHPIAVVPVDRNAPRELDAVMSRLLAIAES
jgi:hypothetical protein